MFSLPSLSATIRSLNAMAAARPVAFGATSAAVKTTAADVLVQTAVKGRSLETLDLRRTAVFTLFGGGWMGFGQYYLYCRLFERLVPGTTALASAGKAALDQLVHVPLLYFPLFYSIDALLQGAWARGVACGVEHVQHRLRTELKESLYANWSLWLPASFVGFRLVPPHWRIPYVSAVSMVWTTWWSVLQGRFRARNAGAASAEQL
ncbi:hypothetical protein EMIHUDRAFT_104368 [Emiliania huxleyi CCMP1516]|uniref:Uncharacterized protein n=2 Tax=Emiliania huxleyi TaxID=2903 RepID=A0A0D3ILF1_EMIH1|nr:hypothetical protein EMIHUDRAFT_104368 [Emiliania huxleyi CCMP1516]EOD12086.1 hypothetical protein EMIHUDRAFT_104368 [Emiliania huxleyi CCMP1516]|eukprot:XP_005764515.1 hypothetical protein EMIHUDRAFT_104368 [Emiliania huxleyi CCMP1516]